MRMEDAHPATKAGAVLGPEERQPSPAPSPAENCGSKEEVGLITY